MKYRFGLTLGALILLSGTALAATFTPTGGTSGTAPAATYTGTVRLVTNTDGTANWTVTTSTGVLVISWAEYMALDSDWRLALRIAARQQDANNQVPVGAGGAVTGASSR